MSKRIIFCADGTWDTSASNTNVYRFYKALPTTAEQMPFYDDGVGTAGLPIQKLAGGAFGAGLFQKIKDGYTKLSQVYEKGDEVFLIGFSRGAYTVRALAGMIAICGLPTHNFTNEVVETAFHAYREKELRADLLAELNRSCDLSTAQISMVGVWDTVGSLGIPAIFSGVSPLLCGFLDTSLNSKVLHGYHAVSIDERRCEFQPTLWSAPVSGQVMEQVWFCGTHGDVGGGDPSEADGTALSDITLAWMISKAAALGVQFSPDMIEKYALPIDPKHALDSTHESWSVHWAFPKLRVIAPNSTLADSVYVRCEHDTSYRPQNLTFEAGRPGATYARASIVTQAAAQSV